MQQSTTSSSVAFEALEALKRSPLPALRQLVVEETSELLILKGRLPSYYYKQVAQETVAPFLNGRELLNKITVLVKG